MIRVALPNKGALYGPCVELLTSCGYKVKKPTKGLYFEDSKNQVEFYFLRASDIPMYLNKGIIDVGVTGEDFHREKQSQASKMLDLPFGHSKLCIAAMENTILDDSNQVKSLRIATSFPNLVKQHFNSTGLDLVELDGAVEISISLGLADCVVDIVETGATLKSAGLKVVGEPIFTSNAALFSAQESQSKEDVKRFIDRVNGRLIALEYQMVEYDVPTNLLDKACELTPGIQSPTISQLKNHAWCSVKSMVKKEDAHQILDQLKAIGCKAILLTNIEMARM
ncbi:ATP phosphoribosyltransferase [Marinomonas aquiplantarum]|uniref:ATP phosphoribosyltransferase n=1 Tax=Marinomonas aquiplantarum TaxID=491951 RepID=A0A366D7J5_9GAMM|nr:ATP phosphoribosyltransferase [Marinomonas aquiplantarum]RBO86017.1 ATP phosphoribosyltransferase [Marinomonas aquiplantarum]